MGKPLLLNVYYWVCWDCANRHRFLQLTQQVWMKLSAIFWFWELRFSWRQVFFRRNRRRFGDSGSTAHSLGRPKPTCLLFINSSSMHQIWLEVLRYRLVPSESCRHLLYGRKLPQSMPYKKKCIQDDSTFHIVASNCYCSKPGIPHLMCFN